MSAGENFTQDAPKYEVREGRYSVLIKNLHAVPKATAYGSTPRAAQECANIIVAALERAVA